MVSKEAVEDKLNKLEKYFTDTDVYVTLMWRRNVRRWKLRFRWKKPARSEQVSNDMCMYRSIW